MISGTNVLPLVLRESYKQNPRRIIELTVSTKRDRRVTRRAAARSLRGNSNGVLSSKLEPTFQMSSGSVFVLRRKEGTVKDLIMK